jgi:hypothetical protein
MLVWMELCATYKIDQSLGSARISWINECLAVYCVEWRKCPLLVASRPFPPTLAPMQTNDSVVITQRLRRAIRSYDRRRYSLTLGNELSTNNHSRSPRWWECFRASVKAYTLLFPVPRMFR